MPSLRNDGKRGVTPWVDKTEGHVAANRQGQSEKVHRAFRRQLSDGSEVRHWDRAGPEGQKTQIGDWAGGEV